MAFVILKRSDIGASRFVLQSTIHQKIVVTYQYNFILKLFSIKHGYYLILLFVTENNNKLFECRLSKFPRSVLKVIAFFLQVKLVCLFLWYNLSVSIGNEQLVFMKG